MPIVKSLEQYFFERNLPVTLPVETLKNSRLGIDVNHYLSRLLGSKRELNIDAIGGFPNSLKTYIRSDVQLFRELNITPIFVFSGNDIVDQYDLKNSKENSSAETFRERAWNHYGSYQSKNQTSIPFTPHDTFRDYNAPFTFEAITRDLIDYFNDLGLEYFVAPYLSWAQLSYFYETEYIDAIYGPTECVLLPNVDKYIFAFEFPEKVFRFVEKRRLLNEFQIGPQQLLEIAVSVGCDLQPVTLPIYNGYPQQQLFHIGLSIINGGGNIYSNISALNNEDVKTRFQKGVLALQYLPVLKQNGRVELSHYDEHIEPPNPDTLPPSDIHDIIGQRLPHEYFFYESLGLINPKILESVVYGTYFENQPIDGGIPSQYKSLVSSTVNAFKNKELNLLTQSINRYYQVKKIHFVKYFDKDDVELDNKMYPPMSTTIDGIVIKSDTETFNFSSFLNSLEEDDLLGKKIIGEYGVSQEADRLKTDYEIIATSTLRTLSLLGLIDFKNGKLVPNKWSKSLFAIKNFDPIHQEKLLTLLIFIKLNAFQITEPFTPSLIGNSTTTDPKNSRTVLLFARLATFLQVEQKQTQYIGPISRNILAFRSSIDLVKNNIRELLECVLVNSLANNEVSKLDKTNSQWRKLVSQIPYKEGTPNTILGIVFQAVFDIYFQQDGDLARAKLEVFEAFRGQHNSISNLEEDLSKGFKFIKQAFNLVEVLHEDNLINSEVFADFERVNKITVEALKK
ncbi:hypothetical protein BN7_138 [Wickerhamomyces ciferrii]|uniref:XPG N-terminal domain-containing protein n=1 Tax=Wickerhamomyces ciferrii (strain ATCC 14091 / BCRC 22168 / CBS 111 / JCM 3599 / NBRC 0793 / NRRL Y-1031 F-60-10) TaxID=1206466 RepID=K0K6R7_WICCF|nr:uncharacterized protein BN7_138 [Wickerhamomyces ciferrii]CCH40605.1 hypothetical protein BN7_138 [Wickerhamomyces ciferrii]